MSTILRNGMFPHTLEKEIANLTAGHSSLAKLSMSEPVPFNGKDIVTFTINDEVALVGEGATKPAGTAEVKSVSCVPYKVVFQMRVSDEFMTASEEEQLDILQAFTNGFAKKLGAGLDVIAMSGKNPATGQDSAIIGNNCFEKAVTTNTVTLGANPDEDIDSACSMIEAAGYESDGLAISPAMRTALAAQKSTDGTRLYPEFAFGATPAALGSMRLDTNATVSANSSATRAIVGDFSDAFRWGVATQGIKVIEYGDPDGQGDLQANNCVVLRGEAYLAHAILDEKAFAVISE